jgi:hypothetical protein
MAWTNIAGTGCSRQATCHSPQLTEAHFRFDWSSFGGLLLAPEYQATIFIDEQKAKLTFQFYEEQMPGCMGID